LSIGSLGENVLGERERMDEERYRKVEAMDKKLKKHVHDGESDYCPICGDKMRKMSVKAVEKLGSEKVVIICDDGKICDGKWVNGHVPNCDVCPRSPRYKYFRGGVG